MSGTPTNHSAPLFSQGPLPKVVYRKLSLTTVYQPIQVGIEGGLETFQRDSN